MRTILVLILWFNISNALGQNIDWSSDIKLSLHDFKSPSSKIGGTKNYSLALNSGIDFYYQMSNLEFMFTKNFNSKVSCTFKSNSAVLVAPDSTIAKNLLAFAQFSFDLSELYARKLRQNIYENKKAFTSPDFFKPLYEKIESEFSIRNNKAMSDTDLGQKKELLKLLHQDVLMEIQGLSDFCKSCKVKKK